MASWFSKGNSGLSCSKIRIYIRHRANKQASLPQWKWLWFLEVHENAALCWNQYMSQNYLITRRNYSLYGTSCCCVPDPAKWQNTEQEQKHGSCLQEPHYWLSRKRRITLQCDTCPSRESFGDLGLTELVPPRERATRHFQNWHFSAKSQVGRRSHEMWAAGLLGLWPLVWLCV